jgi:hypothetical protein
MPLRLDAEVPDDDADRIGVREGLPVQLLGAEILERVFEAVQRLSCISTTTCKASFIGRLLSQRCVSLTMAYQAHGR